MNLRETSLGLLAALAAAAGAISGCGEEAPEEEPVAIAEPGWERFTGEFIDDLYAAEPTRAVWAGRHEFDGELPDMSARAIRQRGDMLRRYARRAQEEFSAESLSPEQDLERSHLVASIESMLFSVEVAEYHLRNPAWYAGRLSPSVYVSREYAPRDERLAALTAHLQKIPAYLEQMRGTLQPPFARPFVRTALVNFGGLA